MAAGFQARWKRAHADTRFEVGPSVITALINAVLVYYVLTLIWDPATGAQETVAVLVSLVCGAFLAPVVIFVWNFYKAPSRILTDELADSRATNADLQRRAVDLEELLRPKFAIIFEEDTHPFYQETSFGSGTGRGARRLFRVGVENLGGATINGLRVLIRRLEPQVIPFAPIEIREMQDATGERSRDGVVLNARSTRFFDVVQKATTSLFDALTEQEIELGYAVIRPDRPNLIPLGEYTTILRAEAVDVPSVEREFRISVDKGSMLLFQALTNAL
ncbi:MAG: hypothetical protein ACRDF5_07890 [bacterium]